MTQNTPGLVRGYLERNQFHLGKIVPERTAALAAKLHLCARGIRRRLQTSPQSEEVRSKSPAADSGSAERSESFRCLTDITEQGIRKSCYICDLPAAAVVGQTDPDRIVRAAGIHSESICQAEGGCFRHGG